MKKLNLLLAVIFMISMADVSNAQVRREFKKLWASDMSYEVAVIGIGADGTKLLKVWGYDKKKDLAKIDAKKKCGGRMSF